jgi:hypothetical protein
LARLPTLCGILEIGPVAEILADESGGVIVVARRDGLAIHGHDIDVRRLEQRIDLLEIEIGRETQARIGGPREQFLDVIMVGNQGRQGLVALELPRKCRDREPKCTARLQRCLIHESERDKGQTPADHDDGRRDQHRCKQEKAPARGLQFLLRFVRRHIAVPADKSIADCAVLSKPSPGVRAQGGATAGQGWPRWACCAQQWIAAR